MAHKGIREFTAEELSGVALGQNGFKIINDAEVICGPGGTTGYTDIKYFIALKVIDAEGEVEARSVTVGDDLTLASGGTSAASMANSVTLVNGDIVYGAFDKVHSANANTYIIGYIGR